MSRAATRITTGKRRGSPLAMLVILLGAWILGRVALWESPFPIEPIDLGGAEILLADSTASHSALEPASAEASEVSSAPEPLSQPVSPELAPPVREFAPLEELPAPQVHEPLYGNGGEGTQQPVSSVMAGGHQMLMAAAFGVDWAVEAAMAPAPARASAAPQSVAANATPAPLPPPFIEPTEELDRWSLDAFAYYRQGSNSDLISQGRAPLYGASQVSANLQYRIAPRSGHDPRAYLRAYRALVTGGESEAAFGVSARPIGEVPVRLAAELRVTDNVFGTETRPAAYAVTDLPPISLPFNFRLEAYGSAGYVGGKAATPFADGQAALTRELFRFDGPGSQPIRLSLGGGAWGGAQEDASRVDVGPTMRVDLSVGEVPARISVDWREQVAGDAAPSSGVAATLSTRF